MAHRLNSELRFARCVLRYNITNMLPGFKQLNINSLIKIILVAACYAFIVMTMSGFIDADFGWHLRFGRDWWQGASFPYQDTYTWTNYGKLWVNHEWGGDILFWFIYKLFGYIGLVLAMAGVLLAAFLLAVRIFKKTITISSLMVVLVSLWAVQHIIVMRLAMLAPFFLVLLWHSLERLPDKRLYYFWPVLFWLWSAWHGSWILGFIVISIYIAGHVLNIFFQKYVPRFYQPRGWTGKNIIIVLFWAMLSAAVTLLNPYGFGLWREVFMYFFTTYDKLHVTDWLASYVYPVYWRPLVIMGISIPLAAYAWWSKKITWPQSLLFVSFWYSAFRYKRNAILFVIIAVPLFVFILEFALNETRVFWKRWAKVGRYRSFLLVPLALVLFFYIINISFDFNPWTNERLVRQSGYPLEAVNFLKRATQDRPTRIFNNFNWGGYLNWNLPQATVFLDGRGGGTWFVPDQKITYLEYYHHLLNNPGGLEVITQKRVRYIFLPKPSVNYQVDAVNRWLFGERLRPILAPPPTRIENDLEKSADWQLVYEDEISRIWENKNLK